MGHVWMQWAIYGMPNGEEIVLSVTSPMERLMLYCLPPESRAPVPPWQVKNSQRFIALAQAWAFLNHQNMMARC
ncbi:hypothetical protein AWI06_03215 [Enterobacter hormaechei subsp. xiangfangensis]|nr:hypothetical protein AWI06_03215 [Enterobacter hormaechei subsp. xiangfangensis]